MKNYSETSQRFRDLQKQRDAALEESTEVLRAVFNSSYDGIAIHALDGAILEANHTFLEMHGLAAEQLPKLALWDICGSSLAREGASAIWARAVSGEDQIFEATSQRQTDGVEFDVEIFLRRIRLRGQDVILNQIRDLSMRRRMEDAAHHGEERFRTLADHIAPLAWMADEHGKIFWYNRRWHDFTGTTLEHMRTEGWRKVLHPDHYHRVCEKLKNCFEQGEPWEDTFPIKGKEGSYRWFLSRAIPIRDNCGHVLRWFGTNTDITEQREASETLRIAKEVAEEASRAKSQFLANMSHELRTPMTVIMGSVQYLLQTIQTHEHRQFLEMADEASQRLLSIIDELLDFSKIEAKRLTIEGSSFDLRQCVRKSVQKFAASARQKGLFLRWEIDPALPERIKGDPIRLRQVLQNLIGNAVKFTSSGQIEVTVGSCDDNLMITVRDTGIGIPPEKQRHLFEPFTQVDSSMTRPYGGTGLGLAISRELISLMGGDLWVQSEEGCGSRFFFTVPLHPENPVTSQQVTENLTKSAYHRVRILVAEDDPMIRKLMQITLEEEGVEVILAENGRQAVEIWKEGGLDLILMDLQMPEMNGLEASRQIRHLEGDRENRICIFALTAHAREEDRAECMAAGMTAFLSKPLRMDELKRMIFNCPCGLSRKWPKVGGAA